MAGFTLTEMTVVIGVLAALGGLAIYAAGDMREQSLTQLTMVEMQKIKQALLQYKQDTGSLPAPAHPADFSLLYQQGSQLDWEAVNARGWRGPYLTRAGEGWVDVGDGISANGSGNPATVAATALSVQGVADPFAAPPATPASEPGSYAPCEESSDNSPGPTGLCVLDWRTASGLVTHTRWGRPYLLFDMTDKDKARIVAMGPNGQYEGTNGSDACLPNGDDVVLCLLR